MNSARRRLLSIGAGVEQLYGIRSAQEAGHDVVGVDGNPQAAALNQCDTSYVQDIRAHDQLIAIARETGASGVIPGPLGNQIVAVGKINDALGLVGPSYETCRLCANKHEFNQQIGKRSVLIEPDSVSENRRCPMPYPFVLKPTDGSGGRSVSLIRGESEWQYWLSQYNRRHFTAGFLCEPYQKGINYGVDGIVIDGHVTLILLRQKIIHITSCILEVGYCAVDYHNRSIYESVRSQLQSVVPEIGLTDGVFHADVIESESGEIQFVELSPRVSGLHNASTLLPAATGLNLVKLGIAHMIGEPIADELQVGQMLCAGIRFFDIGPGSVVTVMNSRERAQLLPDIRFDLNVKQGDYLDMPADMSDLYSRGYAFIQASSMDHVLKQMQQVNSIFTMSNELDEAA